MARRKADSKTDPRSFCEFYGKFMRAEFAKMMTAYLFCEPPPYTQAAGSSEPDLRAWTSTTEDARDLRGEWFNSLVVDDKQADLIQNARRVVDNYRTALKQETPTFRTATECGVWLPYTDEQAEQFAPYVLAGTHPQDLGPRMVYVHEGTCNSRLPTSAFDQRAYDNRHGLLSGVPIRPPSESTSLSKRAILLHADRIQATTEWSLRFNARLEEVLCAVTLMHTMGEKAALSTAAALDWFPWVEDLARLTGCWPQLNEARDRPRGSLSMESLISHSSGLRVDVARLRAHMTVAGFGMQVLMNKAAAMLAGWRESYPMYPTQRMIAARLPHAITPSWVEDWRTALAIPTSYYGLAEQYITSTSLPKGS